MISYFFLTLIIINFLIIYYFSSYSKFVNIIDKPDDIRKFHTKNTISYINDFYAEDFKRFRYTKIIDVEDFRKIEL